MSQVWEDEMDESELDALHLAERAVLEAAKKVDRRITSRIYTQICVRELKKAVAELRRLEALCGVSRP